MEAGLCARSFEGGLCRVLLALLLWPHLHRSRSVCDLYRYSCNVLLPICTGKVLVVGSILLCRQSYRKLKLQLFAVEEPLADAREASKGERPSCSILVNPGRTFRLRPGMRGIFIGDSVSEVQRYVKYNVLYFQLF